MTTSVLIVEDEKIISFDIKNSLQKAGYEVLGVAASGEEAIKKTAHFRPHLVLMDIMLKGAMDGVEAAAAIRDRYGIPVVYLTAHADEQTLNRAKITDPFGYILKPFEDRELITTIEIALSRHKAELAIRHALQKEQELRELKSRFVAVVSHEFRNPLSTILFSSELLEKYHEKLSEQKKSTCLQRIQLAVKRMEQLLENVLTISITDAGKLHFQPAPLALDSFCQNVIEELQFSHSGQHQIILQHQLQDSEFYLDAKLLNLILLNLLSNAIKYSPAGSKIDLEITQQAQSVIIRIQDQGMGIPESDRLQLFNLFHRGSNVNHISGTGLGLSIVKQCVEAHQGAIAVTSEVGAGTTFTVTLPIAASPDIPGSDQRDPDSRDTRVIAP